jgi:hypothetical protein
MSFEALVQQSDKYIIPQGVAYRPYMSKRGELFIADWKQAAILQGLGFTTHLGALSTPALGGGAGTVVDLDQPEIGILIPSGTTFIPLRIAAQLSTPLLATDADETEFLALVDVTAATVAAALDGTWTTTHTPKNMRVALTNVFASLCTVKSLCTADTTDPTGSLELIHSFMVGDVQGTPANALITRHEVLYEPQNPPMIAGPACIFMHWGGTVAVSAFLQLNWLEIPTAQLS